jgi:hypothetical protein
MKLIAQIIEMLDEKRHRLERKADGAPGEFE